MNTRVKMNGVKFQTKTRVVSGKITSVKRVGAQNRNRPNSDIK